MQEIEWQSLTEDFHNCVYLQEEAMFNKLAMVKEEVYFVKEGADKLFVYVTIHYHELGGWKEKPKELPRSKVMN